jgi:hypothetical protein
MFTPDNHTFPMTADVVRMQGDRITLALVDGSRIDDAEVVSVGRTAVGTVWLYARGCTALHPSHRRGGHLADKPARRSARCMTRSVVS